VGKKKGWFVKECYLCDAVSDIKETVDGFLVQCTEFCGHYIITHKAVDDKKVIAYDDKS